MNQTTSFFFDKNVIKVEKIIKVSSENVKIIEKKVKNLTAI